MKTKLFFFFLILLPTSLFSQVPQGFNYQALARDGSGNPLISKDIQVRVSILSDTTGFYASGNGTYLWEEQHTVRTNSSGLFNLVIGTKAKIQGSAASFNLIDWSKGPLFVGTKIQYISLTWKNMGTAKLNSVPYAMLADKANGVIAGSKLSVTGNTQAQMHSLRLSERMDKQFLLYILMQ